MLATIAANAPVTFDRLVERVQNQSPEFSRAAIAAELGGLITRQQVFLNQERSGFCTSRAKRDTRRGLERAVKLARESRVQF